MQSQENSCDLAFDTNYEQYQYGPHPRKVTVDWMQYVAYWNKQLYRIRLVLCGLCRLLGCNDQLAKISNGGVHLV
jgi:hypothetical protein